MKSAKFCIYILMLSFFYPFPTHLIRAESSKPIDWETDDLQSLPLAPLIPLEPQFPLGLTESNRQLLIDSPEQIKKNQRAIQEFLETHAFPWLSLAILLTCGGMGWALFLMRYQLFKYFSSPVPQLSSKKKMDDLLQELDKKELDRDPPQQHYAAFSSIISKAVEAKSGIKTDSLTTAQISQIIKNQSFLSFQEIEELLSVLSKIDQVKFGETIPALTETREFSKKIHVFVRQFLE